MVEFSAEEKEQLHKARSAVLVLRTQNGDETQLTYIVKNLNKPESLGILEMARFGFLQGVTRKSIQTLNLPKDGPEDTREKL